MSFDVGEVRILQPFRHLTYITTHSPTLPSLYLRHSSFSNPSVASPTSQFILQPFFRFSYVTSPSLNSLGEPPMVYTSTWPLLERISYTKQMYAFHYVVSTTYGSSNSAWLFKCELFRLAFSKIDFTSQNDAITIIELYKMLLFL